jgi:hypothetical protein
MDRPLRPRRAVHAGGGALARDQQLARSIELTEKRQKEEQERRQAEGVSAHLGRNSDAVGRTVELSLRPAN